MTEPDPNRMSSPFKFSEERKTEIVRVLESKGISGSCPMCRKDEWALADGYFSFPLRSDVLGGMVLGGPAVPSVALFCVNCGFMSMHAAVVLGLLGDKREEKKP